MVIALLWIIIVRIVLIILIPIAPDAIPGIIVRVVISARRYNCPGIHHLRLLEDRLGINGITVKKNLELSVLKSPLLTRCLKKSDPRTY